MLSIIVVLRRIGIVMGVALGAFALVWCQPFGVSDAPSGANDAGATTQQDALASQDSAEEADVGLLPPGSGCDAGLCESCKALHGLDPSKGTGGYEITSSHGQALLVWCDMDLAGGGWTLVARSHLDGATSDGEFGWNYKSGGFDDFALAYSLDVTQLTFEPREILFGSAAQENEWGDFVYSAVLPPSFLQGHKARASTITTTAVRGPCLQTPSMLRTIGYTDNAESFYFRDNGEEEIFGLRADGWNTNSEAGDTNCSYGARLGTLQGMIYVR